MISLQLYMYYSSIFVILFVTSKFNFALAFNTCFTAMSSKVIRPTSSLQTTTQEWEKLVIPISSSVGILIILSMILLIVCRGMAMRKQRIININDRNEVSVSDATEDEANASIRTDQQPDSYMPMAEIMHQNSIESGRPQDTREEDLAQCLEKENAGYVSSNTINAQLIQELNRFHKNKNKIHQNAGGNKNKTETKSCTNSVSVYCNFSNIPQYGHVPKKNLLQTCHSLRKVDTSGLTCGQSSDASPKLSMYGNIADDKLSQSCHPFEDSDKVEIRYGSHSKNESPASLTYGDIEEKMSQSYYSFDNVDIAQIECGSAVHTSSKISLHGDSVDDSNSQTVQLYDYSDNPDVEYGNVGMSGQLSDIIPIYGNTADGKLSHGYSSLDSFHSKERRYNSSQNSLELPMYGNVAEDKLSESHDSNINSFENPTKVCMRGNTQEIELSHDYYSFDS